MRYRSREQLYHASVRELSVQVLQQRRQLALNEQRYRKLEEENSALVSRLKHEKSRHEKASDNRLDDLLQERMHATPIYQHFCEILLNPSLTPTPDEWMALHDMINSEIPSFFATIYGDEKNISEEEYRLCLLIRLGFKPKEMLTLMDYPPSKNVSVVRKRLMWKIFSESGTAKEFDKRIREIT
ncbi:hypothetical protein L6472_00405 [Prevotella sp. E13-17]|uniref:hypothetical protein n=1 Tax=Prevotella sp. E13-17 TaxID=2913616 RepID=UPI001EDA321F|nr:hypothetical protein [Prevotella sp. E13-17]UKK51092.1 hypothetical protein L6472_00405 [Prevotella sp. E13-17]